MEKEYGSKWPRIKSVIEGILYRGTLMRMETECHTLGIIKNVCEKASKTFGDEIAVTVEPDEEPLAVQVPSGLGKELQED